MIPLPGFIQGISPAATGLPQSDQKGLAGPAGGAFEDFLTAESGSETVPDPGMPLAQGPLGQGGKTVQPGGKELPGLSEPPPIQIELDSAVDTLAKTLDDTPAAVAAPVQNGLPAENKHPLASLFAVGTGPTETAEVAATAVATVSSRATTHSVAAAANRPEIPPGLTHAGMMPPWVTPPGRGDEPAAVAARQMGESAPGKLFTGPPGIDKALLPQSLADVAVQTATDTDAKVTPGGAQQGIPQEAARLINRGVEREAVDAAFLNRPAGPEVRAGVPERGAVDAALLNRPAGPELRVEVAGRGAVDAALLNRPSGPELRAGIPERGAVDAALLNRPSGPEARAEVPLIEGPYTGSSEEKLLESALSHKSLDTVRPNQPPAAQAPPIAGAIPTSPGESPATESVKPGVTPSMTARMGDPGWNNEFAGRVTVLFKNDIQEASLQLNPPELGRLDIRIRTEGDQAIIQFAVQRPDAREAIENAMPQLRQMLEENGLQLARGEVADHSQSGERENNAVHSPATGDIAEQESGDESIREVAFMTPESAVDYYV